MNRACYGLAAMTGAILIAAWLLPLSASADLVDEKNPQYWDDAARKVIPGTMPFALPAPSPDVDATVQIRRLCVQGRTMVAQVFNSLVHFDLSKSGAYSETFPFHIIDITCADEARMHMLAVSWPDNRLYSVRVKSDDPWSGWRRGDSIKLLKDESPLGYVTGDSEVRVLTTQRLLSIKGDKLDKSIRLSKHIELIALARVAVVRTDNDIYFGNDGGEWGGTLYRIDETSGRVSLVQPGSPVVSIVEDPEHVGCVLVARAVSHMGMTDGELTRACHETTQALVKNEPVWGVAGKHPIFVGFSDGVGELKDDAITNRRSYPPADAVVAGLHYAQMPGVMLVTSGISQGVSLSGPVPMLVDWQSQGMDAAQK